MDLQELRRQIDGIDGELIRLFLQRMDVSVEIAKYKQQNHLPVYDPVREREKLDGLQKLAGADRASAAAELFALLFALSRAEQERILRLESER